MDQKNRNILDDDRIGRLMIKLSLPAFFGMFFMTLYNIVDTIFIGHYVGPLGIAGLSIVFPLQMLSLGIGQMTGMGGASIISRLIGAGDISRAERTLANAIFCTVVFSVIISVVGLIDADFWLGVMGASEAILPYAKDYMIFVLIGMIFSTLSISLNNLVRAEGNMRIPMASMVIGATLNIMLDAVFIILLGMGIKGAALATIIAQFVSAMYLLSYYFTGRNYLDLHLKNFLIKWDITKGILAIGVASFARTLAASLSIIFVNRMLGLYGGDYAVSAFGIINRIIMFSLMPAIAIGHGFQPILGFNYGAKRYDKALHTVRYAVIAATTCSIAVFIVLYFIPEPIIRVFTSDSAVIDLGKHAAKRVFMAMYLIGFIMVGSLFFQSIGKASRSFITAISRPFLFLIPLVFLLPPFLGLNGVFLAFPIADALTFLLTLLLFMPQIRKLIRDDKKRRA
jgi:putative MATE family efflux protein